MPAKSIQEGASALVVEVRHPQQAYCCFVWNGLNCGEVPEFVIYDNGDPSPDAYTHACVKHVGQLLGHLDPDAATRDEWLVLPL